MPFDTHSTANLPPLAILKKIKFFSKNPCVFSKKDPNFERFEKSYYFSRILRQICCNLVTKISRPETRTNLPMWRERNWQTSVKKRSI